MRRGYLGEFPPHLMNAGILALFAREINEAERDTQFKAPFRPLRPKNLGVEDDGDMLMNGFPPPPARRRTRASKKGTLEKVPNTIHARCVRVN